MGVAGGSWAYTVTAFNQIWMLAAYILLTGRASVVWGLRPSAAAFKVGRLAVAVVLQAGIARIEVARHLSTCASNGPGFITSILLAEPSISNNS